MILVVNCVVKYIQELDDICIGRISLESIASAIETQHDTLSFVSRFVSRFVRCA